MARVTVFLPLPPYLRKYLIAKSLNKQEPLRFPNKHDYNIMIMQIVTNYGRLRYLPLEDREASIIHFNSKLRKRGVEIQLPYSKRKDINYYNYLSVQSQKYIREEIRKDFYHELRKHIRDNLVKGENNRKILLEEFMEKYEMDYDDINFETLYRQTSRKLSEKV